MKKKLLFISILVLLVVAVAITVSVVAVRNSYMPEIKQGEFPFTLTYKIKETYNIEIVSWDFKEPISNSYNK